MILTRVLVANRGEIALRIVRACRDAGVASVAVHGETDRAAPYVRNADQAIDLKGTSATETYLDITKLLAAAARTDADAVHPGYGFLAENADFAQAVLDAGLIWIGPPPEVIRALGDKVRARAIAATAGAPLTPGTAAQINGPEDAVAFAREHGLPVAIKAAHGGGGRGMRIARTLGEIPELAAAANREAQAAFGRAECFVESYIEGGRHIEAQVLADQHGAIEVLGTRDCTLQRRYQKLVEEAPAPFLTEVVRKEVERCAVDICRAAGYVNAGTVEYLLSPGGALSFLEVNTRLQVEHSVTEESAGVDIVRAQLMIADGSSLASALRGHGEHPQHGHTHRHAVEFRINAEDPARGFAPSTGTVTGLRTPAGPGVRIDSGIEIGTVVDGGFDSLLAKLIVSGRNRAQALERARRAVAEFEISGVSTTLPFVRDILQDPAFVAADAAGFAVHTRWIEEDYTPSATASPDHVDGPPAVRIGSRWLPVDLPGIETSTNDRLIAIRTQTPERGQRADAATGDTITSPMQGTVIRLAVAEDDLVDAGQVVAVVEAMKMENPLTAPHHGQVVDLRVAVGDTLAQGGMICRIEATKDI